jgi:hypothetical protein
MISRKGPPSGYSHSAGKQPYKGMINPGDTEKDRGDASTVTSPPASPNNFTNNLNRLRARLRGRAVYLPCLRHYWEEYL